MKTKRIIACIISGIVTYSSCYISGYCEDSETMYPWIEKVCTQGWDSYEVSSHEPFDVDCDGNWHTYSGQYNMYHYDECFKPLYDSMMKDKSKLEDDDFYVYIEIPIVLKYSVPSYIDDISAFKEYTRSYSTDGTWYPITTFVTENNTFEVKYENGADEEIIDFLDRNNSKKTEISACLYQEQYQDSLLNIASVTYKRNIASVCVIIDTKKQSIWATTVSDCDATLDEIYDCFYGQNKPPLYYDMSQFSNESCTIQGCSLNQVIDFNCTELSESDTSAYFRGFILYGGYSNCVYNYCEYNMMTNTKTYFAGVAFPPAISIYAVKQFDLDPDIFYGENIYKNDPPIYRDTFTVKEAYESSDGSISMLDTEYIATFYWDGLVKVNVNKVADSTATRHSIGNFTITGGKSSSGYRTQTYNSKTKSEESSIYLKYDSDTEKLCTINGSTVSYLSDSAVDYTVTITHESKQEVPDAQYRVHLYHPLQMRTHVERIASDQKDDSVEYDENARLLQKIKELEAENATLRQENTELKNRIHLLSTGTYGDVNGDNTIDIQDAQIILAYYTQKDVALMDVPDLVTFGLNYGKG